ncbi:alpha/beta hydrolase [Eubacterium pyruvativorans]|uniref:alpha/beta hydrolase n=1 Tax=Eubacterium pyruvativorans TaxID=155865 RepID=UPI00156883E2|nr:alpha/beta hydrolase [Eubacterium pyruvativorans]
MENWKLRKGNGHIVPCLAEIPDGAKQIVLYVHGFESCKECDTAELLRRRLPAEGVGVVSYDQPGHGEEEARQEPLGIEACKDSLALVEEKAAARCPDAEILYFGSSYGAYLTGLYISSRPHRGHRFFMRSAAVNMPWLLLGPPGTPPDPEAAALLEKQGYLQPNLGVGNPVKIPRGMFEDLRQNNLFLSFAPDAFGETCCRMVHGSEDPVIDPEMARVFAEKFRIPITFFPGEGHSINLKPGDPDRVVDMALEFFRA